MGVYFDLQTADAIVRAVESFDEKAYDPAFIRSRALRFDKELFKATIKDCLTRALAEHLKNTKPRAEQSSSVNTVS